MDFGIIENVTECRHISATIENLPNNVFTIPATSNAAQVGSAVASLAVETVTVLTTLFMKEGRTCIRSGTCLNHQRRPVQRSNR